MCLCVCAHVSLCEYVTQCKCKLCGVVCVCVSMACVCAHTHFSEIVCGSVSVNPHGVVHVCACVYGICMCVCVHAHNQGKKRRRDRSTEGKESQPKKGSEVQTYRDMQRE